STPEAFPTLHRASAWGTFGVDLFFVISGFVILLTAWGRTVPQYVASRVSRLFPAYWVAVALTGVLLLWIWPDRKPVSVPQVGANLTMVQSAFGIGHLDGAYWTLWTELRFYLLVGLLMLIGLTMTRLVVFAAL